MVIKCPYDWSHWTILCIWQHHLLDFYYLQSNIMITALTHCVKVKQNQFKLPMGQHLKELY